MIPISDENPTLHKPVMTWALLAAMFAVFIFLQGAGLDQIRLATTICNWGMVPGELTHRARLGTGVPIAPGLACVVDNSPINTFTPLISMFLHGGWSHILGNAIFFWVFGNNVEDSMGPGRFLVFYLLCGLIAAGTHILMLPDSPIPTVGASGAISGVLGAYLVLYPRVRINMLFPPFIFRTFAIPAWIVLLYWFGLQAFTAYASQVNAQVSNGVAVWAHVGGFVAGMVLIKLFENPRLVADRNAWRHQREVAAYPG